jgi:hypothetical protein
LPLERGVLDLQPIPASADEYKQPRAWAKQHKRAIALDCLAEFDRVGSSDERVQLGAADLQRHAAPVLALNLQKIDATKDA